MRYWLMKSEPEAFSITDLQQAPGKRNHWDGVRNYQARNFMRDDMQIGDRVLFYHSNAAPSGVAGLARIVGPAVPDPTSWDPQSRYYDPKSPPEAPRWWMTEVGFECAFSEVLSLDALRAVPDLADMLLFQRSRLSIQPVEERHFRLICTLAGVKP